MIKAQIGTAADHVWIYHRFIEGLHDDVRKIVGPNVGPNETIDEMMTRSQRAYEFVVCENARRSRTGYSNTSTNAPRTWGTQAMHVTALGCIE